MTEGQVSVIGASKRDGGVATATIGGGHSRGATLLGGCFGVLQCKHRQLVPGSIGRELIIAEL